MNNPTPLAQAVEEYCARDAARFHMPGHKGHPAAQEDPLAAAYPFDITEVHGADSLFEASGAILRAEEELAALYGASRTLLSAGGSSLCIQTMLALAALEQGAQDGGAVIAGRNLHASALNAMALLGLQPVWIDPQGGAGFGMGGRLSPQAVEDCLERRPDACAVYVTSPDYFGVISDIQGISRVCQRRGVPLLVDNAHGSHLKWEEPSRHPMDLGADMCCDSLHKTLPVLTGGALLHIRGRRFAEGAKARMSLFGSTSPSYLIMLSLDRCLGLLQGGYGSAFEPVRRRVCALEGLAAQKGFVTLEGPRDMTKLVLSVYNWGMSGADFGVCLRRAGIEAEYVGSAWAVLMASPGNREEDYRRVEDFLTSWDKRPAPGAEIPRPPAPKQVMPLRQAVFAKSRPLPVEQAVGHVAASMVCPCPPGIPLTAPGEEITPQAAALLKICGISWVDVVK